MKNKWNVILLAVLLVLTSVFLSACTAGDEPEEQDPTQSVVSNETEEQDPTVSDEPIENDVVYAEDDDISNDESSEEILDGHEEETVVDENVGVIPEEKSGF